jgi:hypothetical protein
LAELAITAEMIMLTRIIVKYNITIQSNGIYFTFPNLNDAGNKFRDIYCYEDL